MCLLSVFTPLTQPCCTGELANAGTRVPTDAASAEGRVWGRADDDSWLNLPLLQTYLAQYDEALPFGIGWMWDREFNETINFFSGGSGMFFSQVRPGCHAQAVANESCCYPCIGSAGCRTLSVVSAECHGACQHASQRDSSQQGPVPVCWRTGLGRPKHA